MCRTAALGPSRHFFLPILFFATFALLVEPRPQLLNSASITGLLISKGSEVKAASVPLLSEPVIDIHSHSAPVSPSELNFYRRKRSRASRWI